MLQIIQGANQLLPAPHWRLSQTCRVTISPHHPLPNINPARHRAESLCKISKRQRNMVPSLAVHCRNSPEQNDLELLPGSTS